MLIAVLAIAISLAVLRCAGGGTKLSRLTVMVSGQTMAYLEHCGCASGVSGGELRKARVIRQERAEAVDKQSGDQGLPSEVLLVELGDFADSSTPVQQLLSKGIVESMQTLDYDSVGLGLKELEFRQSELFDLIGASGLKFTAANLSFRKPEEGEDLSTDLNALIERYRVATGASGYRVGIIHVLDERVKGMRDKEMRLYAEMNGFEVGAAESVVRDILAAHGKEADSWIVTVGSGVLQGLDPLKFADLPKTLLVIGLAGSNPEREAGASPFPQFIDRPYQKAKDLIVAVVNFKDGKPTVVQPIERLNLLESIKEDEQVKAIIANLKPQLERLENKLAEEAWTTAASLPHPWYVGHNTCMACHPAIVDGLSHTHHREAFKNLTLRAADAQRDPRCLPCHVTGYNKPGGWNRLSDVGHRELMQGVSCEACHGAGEYHKMLMADGNWPKPDNFGEDGRGVLGIVSADRNTCLGCHDSENSPSFRFERYWPHIQHNILMSVEPTPGSPPKDGAAVAMPGRGFGNISEEPKSGEQDGSGGM